MDEGREQSVRASLRLVTTAWVFGSVWMHITTGATMTRFARSLGMSEFGFGLLAAIPFAGAILQLPASYLLEKYGHRKRLFLVAGLIHRAMWLAIAAIPWVFPLTHGWWALLLVLSISTALANFSGPAWLTWMADLVPPRIRGRYFSRRGQYGRLVGAVATVAIGWTLDAATGKDMLERALSIALAVAALCGMVDILFHKTVPPVERRREQHVSFRELVGRPLRDSDFRRFLGFNFTLTFAIGYVGQFIWLYLFDVVGMGNLQANVMLIAVPLIASMLTFPIWGRLVDRLGCRPVLVISGLLIVHGGASWVFVTQESWWMGYLAVLLATMSWPGVELANLNMLLRISQARDDLHGHHGSSFVAMHSLVVAVGGTCSGLFGGAVAQALEHWRGSILGWPLTYHGVLLLISAGLRAISLLWLIGMHEPRAYSTRSALRYLVTNIYSNVQQAALMPVRGIGRLGRLTYRLPLASKLKDTAPKAPVEPSPRKP